MTGSDVRGLRRIINATRYSLGGLRSAWRHETAFRQEVLLAVVLVPVGWWLGANGLERALLIGSVMTVLIVELVNSAIEAVVDRIGEERNVLSGRAKDLGSAAVMLSLLMAGLVWGLFLYERFA